MKNIDKIRAMSARELAKELCFSCCFCIHSDNVCKNNDCYESRLEWLNQEDNPMPSFKITDVIETVNNRYAVIGENTLICVKGIYSIDIPAYICPIDDVLAHETVTTIWRYNLITRKFEKIWRADDEPHKWQDKQE